MGQKISGKITPILSGYCSLEFELDAPKTEQKQLHAYVALDKSGSMAGGRINTAKAAVNSLIKVLKEEQITMSLIPFESGAVIMDSRETPSGKGYEALEKFCSEISAGGGTKFVRVFECLQNQMAKFSDQNNVIVFITDGQDASGTDNLKKSMEDFQKFLNVKGYKCAIHAIGVGEGHDATLLTNILRYGSTAGTFQYVANSQDIERAVTNLQGVMEVCTVSGTLHVGKETKYKVNLDTIEEEGGKKVKGVVYLKEEETTQDLSLEAHVGKEEHAVYKVVAEREEKPMSPAQFGDFVRDRVVGIIDVLKNGKISEEQRKDFVKLIQTIDAKVDEMLEGLRKRPTIERKKLMPTCLELKELTTEFYAVLRQDLSASGLGNLTLAKLNDVVYRGVLQRRLAKKLNKRFEHNVGMMEKIDQDVEKLVNGFDKEELRKKYSSESKKLEDQGYCLLSCRNWLEALLDYDCMCITFNVERSQAAIADPSQVFIKAVNNTQLTCESFMESAIFFKSRADGDEENKAGPSFVKGVPASTLVKGLPDEIITGIMPLYISEDHWKVARLKMRPLLGWTATLDILGYAPAQMMTIPFLLFAKAMENVSSEYQKKIADQIKETCMAIYKEYKKGILSDLLPKLSKYLEDPLARTVDSIPSNQVFLAHMYFAMLNGDLEPGVAPQVKTMLPHILEEELRRRVYCELQEPTKFILNMLGASWKDYIDSYESEIYARLMTSEVLSIDPHMGLDKIDGKIKTLSTEAEARKQQFDKMLGSGGSVYTLARIGELFGLPPCTSVLQMGIDTNEKFLTLAIQCILQHKNADRREAIEQKRYVTPFIQESSEAYVKRTLIETVVAKRKVLEAEALTSKKNNILKAKLRKFAITDSLDDAASVLSTITMCSWEFGRLVNYVETHEMTLPLDKAKILVTGKHNGKVVGLRWDAGWSAGKKRVYRIWRINREKEGDLKAWQSVFPANTGTLALHEELWQKGIVQAKHFMRKYKDTQKRSEFPTKNNSIDLTLLLTMLNVKQFLWHNCAL
eukprot:TRINITY_DN88898_c0_g1_i1.p1 TRINITY_DN88898_c0_g1~~TRINITY_DN88898_c0_g1_i1.p1  ORF type:complete len:1026 (-),score=139.68 TRINITY_DN88898_c0_g1_i1:22-3099(-)